MGVEGIGGGKALSGCFSDFLWDSTRQSLQKLQSEQRIASDGRKLTWESQGEASCIKVQGDFEY